MKRSNDVDTMHYEILENIVMMRKQEERTYWQKHDYFRMAMHYSKELPLQRDRRDVMNDSWRRKMCLWSYMVIDHFDLDREVVDIAFNYLDRYLSLVFESSRINPQEYIVIDRKSFQLVSATTLYIAIKLHGGASNFKSRDDHLIDTFVQLSRGLFTMKDIVQMEREILTGLRWHVNPPTTSTFVLYLMRLGLIDKMLLSQLQTCANPERAIYEVAKFFTELSVGDYKISTTNKPFCVAIASILNAICIFIKPDSSSQIREKIIGRVNLEFGLTVDELASISTIQDELKDLCPFPFNQPLSILNASLSSLQENRSLGSDGQRLGPNQTVVESISSPVSTSLFSHP